MTMNLLNRLLRKRLGWVLLTIGLSLVSIAVSLWWNIQLRYIINDVTGLGTVPLHKVLTAATAIGISSCLFYAMGMLSGWTCETLAHDLRMGYAHHYVQLSIHDIENINSGAYLSKLQNELGDVSAFLRSNLFPIVDDVIRFTATFTWMIGIHPRLALVAHLPLIPILGYIVFSSKVIEGATQKSQQAHTQMNVYTDTLVTLFPVIRLFQATPFLSKKYIGALETWKSTAIQEEHTRAKLLSLSALLSSTPLLLLVLLGGLLVMEGGISVGTLFILINLAGNVSGVMMNMPGRIAGFRRFTANMRLLGSMIRLDGKG